MKRRRFLAAALPTLGFLLLAAGGLAGCASGGEDADGDRIKELQDRVLELQRKAAVADVELARLRQQVAELMAKQGMGGAPSGSSSGGPGAPAAPRGSTWRRPAAADGAPVRPPAADRTSRVDARQVPEPPAGGGASPARPAGAGRAPAIDETDIEVPVLSPQPSPSSSSKASPAVPPAAAAGANRRSAAASVPGLALPAPASPAAPAAPAADTKSEPVTPAIQALYDRGYTLYHQKHYVDAETSFQRFLQAEPNSELADNAQYWIGECRYSRGDMRGALAAFREAAARYPTGNKTPDALLKAGMSLESLGDKEGARNTYQEVLRRFPGTAVAAVAEERRAKLP